MKSRRGLLLTAIFALTGALLFLHHPTRVKSQRASPQPKPLAPPRAAARQIGYRSPSNRHKVEVKKGSLAEALKAQGGRLVADYGSYQILEVDSATAQAVSQQDDVEVRDEYHLLLFNAGEVDSSTNEWQARRQPLRTFNGQRLHLVQFAGPVKPAWYAQLVYTGVHVVSYIPHHAYLVYGRRESLLRLKAWGANSPIVQWDGEYGEDWKVHPSVLSRARKDQEAERAAELEKPESAWKKKSAPDLTNQQTENEAAAEPLYGIQLVEDAAENPLTLRLIENLQLKPVTSQFRLLSYLNVVVALAPESIEALASRPDVVSIAPYVVPTKFDERQNQIIAGHTTGPGPAAGDWLSYLSAQGIAPAPSEVADFAVNISDSGVDNGTTRPHHFGFYNGGIMPGASRVIYNRLEGTPNAGSTLQGCDGHGTLNAHIIGGYVPSSLASAGFPHADPSGFRYSLGVAPFVRLGSSVIFDPLTFTFPLITNLEARAYAEGARISSNSWGARGAGGVYNINAQIYDATVRDAQPAGAPFATAGNQEYVIVFAAGNSGPTTQTVSPPGTAKNVITVGASEGVQAFGGADGSAVDDSGADNFQDLAPFSSRGPTLDGRQKPDLVAPGTHISGGVVQVETPAVNGTAAPCYNGAAVSGGVGGHRFFPSGQEWATASSGTSHSTPAVAGVAALIRQHFLNRNQTPPSPALTKALLMNSAQYLTGVGANDARWSNSQGLGLVNLNSYFDIFATPSIVKDQSAVDTLEASGQSRLWTGFISDPSKPFRVTLAWTDAPGSTVGHAYVNNLDLEVIVNGQTYHGNVFQGAFSTPGGAPDGRNNVESVFLPAGASGSFVVKVKATNIAGDGVPNFGGPLDQDFSLVIYNSNEGAVPVLSGETATLLHESCSPGNGVIDPQETVTVNLALKNIGTGPASDVTATLLPVGGISSPSGAQSYGAIPADGPPVARSFSFNADVDCGDTITASLLLQDGATVLGTVTFTFTAGTPGPEAPVKYSSGGIDVPIPDFNTVEHTITVPDNGIITDLNVRLRANHTFDGDLDFFLISPDGTQVELSTDNGSINDNYGSGATDCSGTATVFDDAGFTSIIAATAPFAGTFRPEQPLAAFNGRSAKGEWKLRVTDDTDGDVGSLFCWELEMTRVQYLCCGVAGTPNLTPAGTSLTADSCHTGGAAIDPDETVTVNFALQNIGTGRTTNLVATLLPTDSVLTPGAPQTYGMITPGGPAVSRPFTFVPQGPCGSHINATLQLQDGGTDLGTVNFSFKLGSTISHSATVANATNLTFPGGSPTAFGPATPYPSGITVADVNGTVSQVKVTLTGISHTFPDDLDLLLVGPGGQKVMLMSDTGGSADISNVDLTFDDAAARSLPDLTLITSGTYRPTNFGLSDPFAAPAPAGPLAAGLSAFNGLNPNGTWSLFAVDDGGGDGGSIAGGWSLEIITSDSVCCVQPCTLSCPPDIVTPNTPGQYGALVNFAAPGVNGSCGTVSSSHPAGSFFPVGRTTVTHVATGSSGHTTACSFNVTVQDVEPPSISCPANIDRVNDAGQCAATLDPGRAMANDNGPSVYVVGRRDDGRPLSQPYPVGTTIINWSATDIARHVASCVQTITVTDHEAPVISGLTTNPERLWPPDRQMVDVLVNYQLLDNCDAALTRTLSISSNAHDDGRGQRRPDWQIINAHHVRLRAARLSHGPERVYTITIMVKDQRGNSTSRSVQVKVARGAA